MAVLFIYKSKEENNKKHLACLALKLSIDNKIINSKIKKEIFNLNENIQEKWPWAVLNNKNHFFIEDFEHEYKNLAEDLLDKALQNFNSKLMYSTNDIENLYKEYPEEEKIIKIELMKNIIFLKNFLNFQENPESIYDFPLFKELKRNNENYLIEDWLIDMEKLFGEV